MKKKFTEEELKRKNLESIKRWQRTPYGRASHLLNAYRQHDRTANRGECTLTADWIVENIFSKPCAHCGETDWTKLGCNRLDNSKPHTVDNVEPCCFDCNRRLPKRLSSRKRGRYVDRMYQYTPEGKLVGIHDGYFWSIYPL